MVNRSVWCIFLVVLSFPSCSYLSGFPLFNTKQMTAGPKELFDKETFESLDLTKILGQTGMSTRKTSYKGDGVQKQYPTPFVVNSAKDLQVSIDGERRSFSKDYDLLGLRSKSGVLIFFKEAPARNAEISIFFIGSEVVVDGAQDVVELYTGFERQFTNDTDGTMLKRARNSIQERILAASNSRCDQYKTFLMQFESEGNFFWGAASIITGGLGAIFTPAATARALAGAAGITGGMHAEWQQDYFHKLTTQVIMGGIESKRLEMYSKIKQKQSVNYNDYTIMAAINDAVRYHGACSLVDGLQEAGDAVRLKQDVGFVKLQEYLKASGLKAGTFNLEIDPPGPVSLSVKQKMIFKATGGTGRVTFSHPGDTTGSTLDPNSGAFTAGDKPGVLSVQATDQQQVMRGVPVLITPEFEFDSPPASFAKSTTYDIAVKGGTPPYKFTLKQNPSGGFLQTLAQSSEKIRYTTGSLDGIDEIEAVDSATFSEPKSLRITVR